MVSFNPQNVNPYLDEVSIAGTGVEQRSYRQSNAARVAGVDGLESEIDFPELQGELVDALEELEEDMEFQDGLENAEELERDTSLDEFTTFDPRRQGQQNQGDNEEHRRRKRKRLEKVRRTRQIETMNTDDLFNSAEFTGFMHYLDQAIPSYHDLAESENLSLGESISETDGELGDWDSWFKPQKIKPPAPNSTKPLYLREEFNTKRSPHMWKSDPHKKWITAFGRTAPNKVVDILYKYQNETIEKAA